MRIVVQEVPFDPGAEANAFSAGVTGAGAIVTFSGIVRDEGGRLRAMEIEHYPGMTERAIREHAETCRERFRLSDVLVIHRFGHLEVGEAIMMVATAAPHRGDAFEGAQFLMDFLKSRAPFWKKELGEAATSWVDAKEQDERALERWSRQRDCPVKAAD